MNTQSFSQTAAYIWSLADLLRGDFKQGQYGRIILPFTILRRLECVLGPSKAKVLAAAEELDNPVQDKQTREDRLRKAAGHSFFNTSAMELSKLENPDLLRKLKDYVACFSSEAREIFEHFRFGEFIAKLDAANLLFKVVQRVAATDLHPDTISNRDMGLVFEELIRKFAESSNETAGEHFTPRDIVRLTTSLVFMEDRKALGAAGSISSIYDPTAGTGGFLSSALEYLRELNPNAQLRTFGQELNPESYAVCQGDMLIKGLDLQRIKLGNTLSQDQLVAERFDYMLSNPPFGVDWKKIASQIKDEHKLKGFEGRFGPGLPRVSDGSLLFLLHLVSKMRRCEPHNCESKGARIGIILSASPLFSGGAGSGESEIRRYILEQDLLEAIVALPTDMFYNTGIATYIWVLSNKKNQARKGKVQLINAVHLYRKMRKSLGSKRHELADEDAARITQAFGEAKAFSCEIVQEASATNEAQANPFTSTKRSETKRFASKIFATHEFGYRRLTIERPLRLSTQFSAERIASLRFSQGPLKAAMQWAYEKFSATWKDQKNYGEFSAKQQATMRAAIESNFKDLKAKQIEELLSPQLWHAQRDLMKKAQALANQLGSQRYNDFNDFNKKLDAALKTTGETLDAKEKKQLLDATSWADPQAEPVVHKVLKDTPSNPVYGAFEYRGKVVQFKADRALRDYEDLPLTEQSSRDSSVDAANEAYFNQEVAPHVKDAWINAEQRDARDGQVGIVGYEIPFSRHFYEHRPPRALQEIDAELRLLSQEIVEMLGEGTIVTQADPYPRYRETDDLELRQIPEHWKVSRLAHIFTKSNAGEVIDRSHWGQGAELLYTCKRRPLRSTFSDFPSWKRTGDLDLLLTRNARPYVHLPKKGAIYSNVVQRITLSRDNCRAYLAYSLGNAARGLHGHGVSIESINFDAWKRLRFAQPPLEEQRQIAKFLDDQTRNIDALADKQRVLIELLEEKAQALLHHTLTKGLNHDAPMRDSGIQWMGKLPAHWKKAPLKRFLRFQRGHDLPADARVDGPYPIISSAGPIGAHNAYRCQAPTIVTGRYGTIGEFYLAQRPCWPLNTALYSVDYGSNRPRYLVYMLRNMKHLFVLNALKSAVPGVDRNDIHVEAVAAPTCVQEQDDIADYLDAQMSRFTELTQKISSSLRLLQERKSALICAAVSGKIDVRNWTLPSSPRPSRA